MINWIRRCKDWEVESAVTLAMVPTEKKHFWKSLASPYSFRESTVALFIQCWRRHCVSSSVRIHRGAEIARPAWQRETSWQRRIVNGAARSLQRLQRMQTQQPKWLLRSTWHCMSRCTTRGFRVNTQGTVKSVQGGLYIPVSSSGMSCLPYARE